MSETPTPRINAKLGAMLLALGSASSGKETYAAMKEHLTLVIAEGKQLERDRAAAISAKEQAERESGTYLSALGSIAKCVVCFGPDCPFCENDKEHPPSHEAAIAMRTLREAKEQKEQK